ncbi:hypothetical protein VB796_15975 [Arcicella sp. LKC2W]|uniref:hypothetical protein n=1 Tax=Arcicella sp. LKC2W TaxID=2984198 RepID=UPI002B22174E|nr:hypothetical protein [Arcicella sp. LKC2W]MEA5460554.1 hypothetical protein [Arcicella sp. LKC2W]
MKQDDTYILDFEIDKLTNSIENAQTGEIFDTEIVNVTLENNNREIKKSEWIFNWKKELQTTEKQVFKLITPQNPKIIHGLLSIEDKNDHIFMYLLESAKFNKGQNKVYVGVPANLVAYACKISFEKGYEGFVAFDAKSAIIDHYKITLGATHFKGLKMFIEPEAAKKLVKRYFKTFEI